MSSHHIIREAQEPALLILSPEYLEDPTLASILEWSPTIVALADMFSRLTESGLKVDVVIGRQEQLSAISSLIESQAPVETILIQEKENPVLAAFKHLKKNGQEAVNILSTPGQVQEDLLELLAPQEFMVNIVLLDGKERCALCRSGHYSKWLPAGERLRLKPAIKQARITTSGFTQNLDQQDIKEAHSLQLRHTGRVQIQAAGPIWVIESLI
jgi:thiamine pyrophosphokinase